MSSISIASLRLGKTSVQAIKDLNQIPAGITTPFEITVKCTQVPSEFKKGAYVLIWLGSDNSKGMPTEWKQGYKAFGRTKSIARGKQFNDESTTVVEILYGFGEAINRLDFLKYASEAYYDCSSLPIIGIDDHSNQTIRMLQDAGERSSIGAMFYALNVIDRSYKTSLLQIDPGFAAFFSYLPQSLRSSSVSLSGMSTNNVAIQKIYYGCPGTGKSYKVKGLTEGTNGEKIVYFDEKGTKIDDISAIEDKSKITSNIFRTTFHPDYDYSSFVGSYKPVMLPVPSDKDTVVEREELAYEFVPQVFTNAYVRAWKSLGDQNLTTDEKQVYLIIEEINRGNCAQIFGDLFQLLDRRDGRSEFAIIPDAEIRKYLEKQGLESNKLVLPENLHILATMNTSDQSLFPMDSAFKRRWAMEYVPINLEQDRAKGFIFTVKGQEYLWVEFLGKVNQLIRKATDSEDKQMGEFFIKNDMSEADFVNKVMFYIWNDVCKDLYSASRISPLYFMRSDAGDNKKDVFTFAELFGRGRYDEEDNKYTDPKDLLEGFITKYLELTPKAATQSE